MFTYFVEKFKASDYCPVLATRGKFLMFCKMTSEWLWEQKATVSRLPHTALPRNSGQR